MLGLSVFYLQTQQERCLSTLCRSFFIFSGWSRQQAGDALVEDEEERDAFGVGRVGFFATAGLVGGVYGGVYFLVGLE
jgi:hypothetical protein